MKISRLLLGVLCASLSRPRPMRSAAAARSRRAWRSAFSAPSSATASRRSRACPAIRRPTTPAPRRAACGRRPTAASAGHRCPIGSAVAAIGALAVAPSDPTVVWAGTGEAWAIRDSDVIGDGIYKSMDAGKTWTHMGLDETGRIGRILIHPTNPDIVFACAIGRITGAAAGARRLPHDRRRPALGARALRRREHRLLRPVDGREEPAHDLCRHVAGRDASLGDAQRRAGSGIYVSRDGGTKWTKIEAAGLPKSPLGKIDVAVAPSDSNRVYALIQTKDQGSVWRSDDGGASWRVVNWSRELIGRAGYYIHLAVSPAERGRDSRLQQLVLPVGRRRPDVPQRATGAATTTTSGGIRRMPIASRSPTTPASR